jgi:hypothetical protein
MALPLDTKTGWPAMNMPVPPGELSPLFGANADGFWERTLKPMAGASWEKHVTERVDARPLCSAGPAREISLMGKSHL